MSVNEKMTALADAIRAGAGLPEDALTLDAMAAAIPAVRAAGKTQAEAVCAGKHFVAAVRGSGTKSLSAAMPFYPDALIVMTADARVTSRQIILFNFTPRSVSYYLGCYAYTAAADTAIAAFASLTRAKLSQATYESGVFTLTVSDAINAVFSADCDYILLASKTETRTDREILEDFVAGLADTGDSITLAHAAVNAAMTDAEWAALIATKPSRTFILK